MKFNNTFRNLNLNVVPGYCMKRHILIPCLILSLCFLTCGCLPLLIGAGLGTVALDKESVSEVTAVNKKHLSFLTIGLSQRGTISIMGTTTFHAYRTEKFGNKNMTKEIIIPNPYESKVIKRKGKAFEVVYYVTDDKNNDGEITDEDLTPLVFDHEKLIGWGWDFLTRLIPK